MEKILKYKGYRIKFQQGEWRIYPPQRRVHSGMFNTLAAAKAALDGEG